MNTQSKSPTKKYTIRTLKTLKGMDKTDLIHDKKEMGNQELKDRTQAIREGIDDFQQAFEIYLSKQNIKRLTKHLLLFYASHRSISSTQINNHLSKMFEYHEFNRQALETGAHVDTEQFEELVMGVLISADNKLPDHKRHILAAIATLIIIAGIFYWHSATMNAPITIEQSEELRQLVNTLVGLERQQAPELTHKAIWHTLKSLDNIKSYGYKPSYKEFSYAQYIEAKEYLTVRIEKGTQNSEKKEDSESVEFHSPKE